MSFKRARNDALREALIGSPPAVFETTAAKTPPSPAPPVIALDHALRVGADLEDEDLVRKWSAGK